MLSSVFLYMSNRVVKAGPLPLWGRMLWAEDCT